jgi:four helix bundle protein
MGKANFKELKVWQRSTELAVLVYKFTNDGAFSKDFGLRDQMRRAAISVPSNIAEGNERETDKEAVRFFYFARGSAAELLTQAIVAKEIGYIDQALFSDIEQRCLEISRMLARLIAARST